MEKRVLSLLSAGLAAVFLFTCRPRPQNVAELIVSGAQGRALALFEISEKGPVFIDSLYPVKRKDDNYAFSYTDLRIYALFARGGEKPLVLLPTPEEKVHLHACYDSLVSGAGFCDISNSPTIQTAVDYQQRVLAAEERIEDIRRHWLLNRYKVKDADSLHTVCRLRIDSILSDIRHEAMRLCQQNTYNLIPVFIANKNVAEHTLFDLENGGDVAFLRVLTDSMLRHLPDNGHARRMLFNVERAENRLKQRQILTD
ncbi:MAG: hypothetical protein NC324_09470 [Bacteroides sp.]|nr:hypothetical protein [Bacteroides sp.]